MGQYFIIVNLDKKEFLESHWFGHHSKLPSFARTAEGAMAGLALLLACSGSGWYSSGPIYGRWAGDRIAIVGDYFHGTVGGHEFSQDIWYRITNQEDGWAGIGEQVRHTLETDWELTLPPPMLDGAEPRSVLHPDGTITAVPGPVWDEASSSWLPPTDQTDES
jgi:hypothetical protein